MRLNISRRIALSLGVLVFLFLATCLATYHLAKRVEQSMDRYLTVDGPRQAAVLAMRASLADYGRLVTIAAASGSEFPIELSKVAQRFEKAVAIFVASPGNAEIAGMGNEMRGRIRQLDGQARALLSADGDNRRAAFGAFQSKFDALADLLARDIQPAVERRAVANADLFLGLAREPLSLLLIMIASGGLIGAVAAIVLIRGIITPLKSFVDQATAMTDPDHEGLVEIGADDELGQLADSFNNMLERRRATEKALEDLAHIDALTQLPNRLLFQVRLKEAAENARRIDRQMAVFVLDLDNFKDLNDSMGHAAGDELLIQVAGRLIETMRGTDLVARLGGDEFAVIQTNINMREGVGILAQRVLEVLLQPYEVLGTEVHSGASMGITLFPDDHSEPEQLLKNAELALYRAKEDGRGRYQTFDPQMNVEILERREMERDLRIAIERDQFTVEYQPRYRMSDRVIVGAEALIRWSHPERGPIPPDRFIAVAERTGIITQITELVLEDACSRARQWTEQLGRPIQVSVNLSPVDFRRPDICDLIQQNLQQASLAPELLELEITEGMVMHGADVVRQRLADIHVLGVSLAIDDFGTGFSSMSYLKTFPVDTLKIDRSFIGGIPANREDISITMAIIRLAHSLNLTLVAEGVETKEQYEFLNRRNCDQAQGYLLSRPCSGEHFAQLLLDSEVEAVPAALQS